MEILEEESKLNLDSINVQQNEIVINSNYEELLEDYNANIDLSAIIRNKN